MNQNRMTQRPSKRPPSQFAKELQDGEILLWEGCPEVNAYVWHKTLRDSVFVLPLIFVGLWLESLRSPGLIAVGSPLFWSIGVFAFAAGTWGTWRMTWWETLIMGYALTDRRVLIRHLVMLPSQKSRVKVESIALHRLRPRLLRLGPELGTITFGLSVFQYPLAFRAIRNAPEVFNLLTEARAALPDTSSTRPYYEKQSSTASSSSFGVTEHLRRGEIVLWSGRPNAEASRRAEVPLLTSILSLLLVLIGGLLMAGAGSFTWLRLLSLALGATTLSFSLFWWAYRHGMGHLAYFVTNQRVLILQAVWGKGADLDERDLSETIGLRLVRGWKGTGTIIFEKESHFVWHGYGGTVETTEFSFKRINDPESVIALITEARNSSAGIFNTHL